LSEYGLRFEIEESFLDEKSGGYQQNVTLHFTLRRKNATARRF